MVSRFWNQVKLAEEEVPCLGNFSPGGGGGKDKEKERVRHKTMPTDCNGDHMTERDATEGRKSPSNRELSLSEK